MSSNSSPYFLQPLHPDNEKGMKSVNDDRSTKITFVNNRSSAIHLWWLDYDGNRVSYETVSGNGGKQDMDTYVTHPWVVVDESLEAVLGIYHPAEHPAYVVLI